MNLHGLATTRQQLPKLLKGSRMVQLASQTKVPVLRLPGQQHLVLVWGWRPPERSTPATRLSACMLLPASPDPKAGKQSQGCVYARLTYGTPMDHLQHSNVPRQGLKIYNMSTTQAHVVWRA